MSEEPSCDNCGHMQVLHDARRCYGWNGTCKCTNAPSSLRAELAEAKAEIARLTVESAELEDLVVKLRVRELTVNPIVEAATVLKDRWRTTACIDGDMLKAIDALVTAVEEGNRT